jgi:sister-chromatid-cohesion protein PDS5
MIIEHIIPALADSTSAYHSEHLHVVRCLDEVESILLISDLPSATNLMRALFTAAFDVLTGSSKSSGKEVTKMTSIALTALLTTVVGGANNLPDEVIDIVMAQFLRADPRSIASTSKPKKGSAPVDEKQATLMFKDAPAAYTMAQEICIGNDSRMARYVLRYFSAILLDTTILTDGFSKKPQRKKHTEHDDDDAMNGPSEEELKESKKAHQLLRELWRAAPSVLQDIIPQLEAELATDNTPIRLMAVEAVGDMIAGIGAAGPPTTPVLDPAAYPSQSLVKDTDSKTRHFMLTPSSTVSFLSRFGSTYQAFIGRRKDKSPTIRAAWTTGVGRILSTSAGEAGLDSEQEKELLKLFAESLVDSDERVRHAAIKAIEQCSFAVIVTRLGKLGGVSEEGSILAYLADRVKDRKLIVRNDGTRLLASLWGVASGAIAQGDDTLKKLFGDIPTKLFSAYYVNDPDIHKSIDIALYESLIPLSYPPTKSVADTQQKNGDAPFDADRVRVERILLMLQSLDDKSKAVFLSKQQRQPQSAKLMTAFVTHCEYYNGGVIQPPEGATEKTVEASLNKLIEILAMHMPDKQRVADDLKRFAKLHDRRNYNLIRWSCSTESDWSKIRKSIREMTKRIEDSFSSSTSPSSMLDALLTLVYRSSVLIYNRAHVPAIIHFSRTDEKGLGATAHEMLKELSKTQGEVFGGHVQDLCKTLTTDAPTATKQHRSNGVDDLKACAEFAKKFSDQLPQDRKFFNALLAYAKFGAPLAAKYATRILLTTSDKREMYAKDVFIACTKGFKYGATGFLSKLAALSQLVFYGFTCFEQDDIDKIHNIAIKEVLMNTDFSLEKQDEEEEAEWTETPDEHIQAKRWAIKILVNALRAIPDGEEIKDHAEPTFKFLTNLLNKEGQISTKKTAPKTHASILRLIASESLMKLAREKRYNELVNPELFNKVALMAQDTVPEVRTHFVTKTTKYLGQKKLPNRYFTPLFLLAHEPQTKLRRKIEAWLHSRAEAFARDGHMVMELIIARLISLLAHHPDYPDPETDDSTELVTMAHYFVFYLKAVATEDNISLIFHMAQRVKNLADGITPGSTNIYVLSDMAQAIIRRWEEQKDWNMHTWTERINLPQGVFAALSSPKESQDIANTVYLPAEILETLEPVIQAGLRTKKTKKLKAENGVAKSKKRPRDSSDTKKGTPSKRRKSAGAKKKQEERWDVGEDNVPSSDRRRSGRARVTANYEEDSEEVGEDETIDGAEEDEEEEEEEEEVEKVVEEKVKAKANGARSTRKSGRNKLVEVQSDESALSDAMDEG